MGWEQRRGRKDYYRKRRIGDRVMSEFVGTGPVAEAAAAIDERERLARERQPEIDQEVDQVCRLIRHLIYAALLLNGYHMHRGQWRKKT